MKCSAQKLIKQIRSSQELETNKSVSSDMNIIETRLINQFNQNPEQAGLENNLVA